jgi:hypothetical protein
MQQWETTKKNNHGSTNALESTTHLATNPPAAAPTAELMIMSSLTVPIPTPNATSPQAVTFPNLIVTTETPVPSLMIAYTTAMVKLIISVTIYQLFSLT